MIFSADGGATLPPRVMRFGVFFESHSKNDSGNDRISRRGRQPPASVKGVKGILEKRDPQLAKSKLIFPTESYTKNCTFEPVLDGEQGREVTMAFNAVING
jgi:hypothetical protein